MKKKKSYGRLVSELDIIFARWVKLSNQVATGICQCITCGTYHPIETIQAGHFISRRYYATRWDRMNVKPQCAGCNGPRGGDPLRFEMALIERYGKPAVERLKSRAIMNGEHHAPREQIEAEIKEYTRAVKELESR